MFRFLCITQLKTILSNESCSRYRGDKEPSAQHYHFSLGLREETEAREAALVGVKQTQFAFSKTFAQYYIC